MRNLFLLIFLAAGVQAGTLPDPSLTPGATRQVSLTELCEKGSAAKARAVPESEKREVYSRYGMTNHAGECAGSEGCEVDHLISLELGGSNDLANLWIEPYPGEWGAHKKDALENYLHRLVCAGDLDLIEAQRAIAGNWIATYQKYMAR